MNYVFSCTVQDPVCPDYAQTMFYSSAIARKNTT